MANFTDKQIADVADSLFIEAPHEAELLKEIIPSLMIKVNNLEGAESSSAAEDISYDNSNSSLASDDVQTALDEVVTMIPSIPTSYNAEDIVFDAPETGVLSESDNVQDALDAVNTVFTEFTASNLIYDNETSGLTFENVQAAIDEVVTMIPSIPTSYTATDITYTNAAISGETEVGGALDAIVDIIREDLLTRKEATVPNSSDTVSLTADPSFIDGRIVSIVPVSGAESAIAGSSIDGTGVLTVTLAAAQAAGDAVFNVYVQKVVPA